MEISLETGSRGKGLARLDQGFEWQLPAERQDLLTLLKSD